MRFYGPRRETKGLYHGQNKFLEGQPREITSGQDGPILPAQVANQDRGFTLFSRITENLIKIKRGKMAPFSSSVIILFISPCFVWAKYVILHCEKRVCN